MNKLTKPWLAADRDSLGHWLWVLPALLIVAALSLRQIDLYAPTADEFYSMYNAGWLINGPYSPPDVIESLHTYSPNHTPGYFILLSIWGNLIGYEVAVGRVLGIFFGLLSLAITYRLARDFVAPTAALFAVIILASNAFSNFYFAHVRMYAMSVFLAGVVLWLYLRLTKNSEVGKPSDYVALAVATFLFLYSHAFTVVFMLNLAIYHLFFAPRGRRWFTIAISPALASLLALPAYLVIISSGVSRSLRDWSTAASDTWHTLSSWLTLVANGQPLLLLLAVAGLALAFRRRRRRSKPIILLVAINIVLIIALNEFTQYVITTNLRYFLPALVLYVALIAAGLYHYRIRHIFGILLALWIIAGVTFQATSDWYPYIAGRTIAFENPPWHIISRLSTERRPQPQVVNLSTTERILDFAHRIPYSQKQHYFTRHGIAYRAFRFAHQIESYTTSNAITEPRFWILYDIDDSIPDEITRIDSTMRSLDYDLCLTMPVGTSWVMLAYSWNILECEDLQQPTTARNPLINHSFYVSSLMAGSSQVIFADAWSSLSEFDHDHYALSYQLITSDWDNVAQLDPPLVHEGDLRRFSIDISDVAPGAYRLMLILYHKRTGQTVDWTDNPGYLPHMLPLAEVVVS